MPNVIDIPIWEKLNLTIEEAAAYSNIGINTLREIINGNQTLPFVMYIGSKKIIKRHEFEEWNKKQYIIK